MNRQVRAELTRSQILAAAAQVFITEGYVNAGVNEIVELAEVTKGALYFHFESKATLARALISERDQLVQELLRSINEAAFPALEKIIHFSVALTDLAANNLRFQAGDRLLLELAEDRETEQRSAHATATLLAELIGASIAERDFIEVDPSMAAQVIMIQLLGGHTLARSLATEDNLFGYLAEVWNLLITAYVVPDVQPFFRQLVDRMLAAQRGRGQPQMLNHVAAASASL